MTGVSRAADRSSRPGDGTARAATAPRAAEVALAALCLLALAESALRSVPGAFPGALRGGDDRTTLPLALLLGLLALGTTLPRALPRPAPAAVAATAAAVLSLMPFHSLTLAGAVAQPLALYRLGRSGAPLLATVLAAPYPVLALLQSSASTESGVLTVLLAALAPAAGWAGAAVAARAEAEASSAATRLAAGTLLEHSARGERARIARELHDVVAHHISMVAVQAETARLTTPGMPAAGAQRLSAIGDTARAALTEMRRLLGVLREDTGAEAAERRPQPGLGQLNDLLDEARDASGAGARLIVRGAPDPLDPGVELAAYRIVQEALTNARRHAPGAAVDVELHYAGPGLTLRIRDNGPGPSPVPPQGGLGLLGMRERAAAVGGELRTGRAPGGGFLVETRLPTEAAE